MIVFSDDVLGDQADGKANGNADGTEKRNINIQSFHSFMGIGSPVSIFYPDRV